MGKLQRYILRSFLTAATLTALVLTFILSVGFLFQVFRYIVNGAPAVDILRFIGASFPEVFGFTIPLSLMIASLLVFGRMSTDSEVAAMKACGVSFFTIMRGPLIISLLATGLAIYLQHYAMPEGHFLRRTITNKLAVEAGEQLVEPGRFVDEMDDFIFFCDRKSDMERIVNGKTEKYTQMYGVMAIDRREKGVFRAILADSAEMDVEGSNLRFILNDVIITPPYGGLVKDGTSSLTSDYGIATGVKNPLTGKISTAKSFRYTIRDAVSRSKKYVKKPKDYNLKELIDARQEAKLQCDKLEVELEQPDCLDSVKHQLRAARKQLSHLTFLISYRTVWAISCFCFVLVGVPLGCQAQRKESSRGMVMGLVIGLAFFLFILMSESLATTPAACPWLLVWIPVFICIGVAMRLIPKHQ